MSRSIPYLDDELVRQQTPMPVLLDALCVAFGNRHSAAPARLAAEIGPTRQLLVMPAWRGASTLGVKIVDVDRLARPAIRATYLLIDGTTGEPAALLDGAMLTRRRTAAISALAARYLARPDSSRLLVLGTGALIAPLIEAYSHCFPLSSIEIWGRDPAKSEAVAANARTLGYPALATTSIDEGLARADIVCSATLATSPLIFGERLTPGTHVDLIGAFRRDMREADDDAFARARVFVDTCEGALHEAGDLIHALSNGSLDVSDIEAELAELCDETHPGRAGDDHAITLFKSVGTGIADLAAAELVVGPPAG